MIGVGRSDVYLPEHILAGLLDARGSSSGVCQASRAPKRVSGRRWTGLKGIELDDYQTTLKSRVTLSGIGVHSGQPVTAVHFTPADRDTGVIFHCTGANGGSESARLSRKPRDRPLHGARRSFLAPCRDRRTSDGGIVRVGIDNVVIEIEGSEVPILDERRGGVRRRIRSGRRRATGREAPLYPRAEAGAYRRAAPPGPSSVRMPARALRSNSSSRIRRSAGSRARPTSLPISSAATSRAPAPSGSCGTSSGYGQPATRSARRWRIQSSSAMTAASSIWKACAIPTNFARHKTLDAMGDLALAGARFIGCFCSIAAATS